MMGVLHSYSLGRCYLGFCEYEYVMYSPFVVVRAFKIAFSYTSYVL